jgi:hypothetical protein
MGHVVRVIGVLALAVAPVFGQTALLMDHSGSVRPYYDSGLFAALGQEVVAAAGASGAVQIFGFDAGVRQVATLDILMNDRKLGANTFLDRAVQEAIDRHCEIAWMITDNIQDNPKDPEAGNTAAFYAILRGDAVKKVVVLPLLQSPGQSGIAIYAMLLSSSSSAASAFEDQVRAISGQLRSHYQIEALRMKPLDRDTVEVQVQGLTGGKQAPTFEEGKDLTVTLEVRFKSRFEHLKIVDSHIQPVKVTPEFAPESLLRAERREVTILPDRVAALDPRGETAQVYHVDINMGRVKLKNDLKSLFQAAWGGKSVETVTLSLPLVIEVPQRNFRFRDSFLDQYHAPSIGAAKLSGKVYALETLPMLLSDAQTNVATEIPVSFRVRYPWYPAIVTLALILLLLAAAAGIVWAILSLAGSLKPKKKWSVTATSEYGQPLAANIREDNELLVEGDPAGHIQGNTLVPGAGAEFINCDGRIVPETPIALKIGRRTVMLKFREATASPAGAGAAASEKPYAPKVRD